MLAALAACKVNVRSNVTSLHMYVQENAEYLPFQSPWGQHDTCEAIPAGHLSGMGLLYVGEYADDHRTFYCPGARGWKTSGGWGGDGQAEANRQRYIRSFDVWIEDWRSSYGLTETGRYWWSWGTACRIDYVVGWWNAPRFQEYTDKWVVLTADARTCDFWPRSYHPSSHDHFRFQNAGRTDGAVGTVNDLSAYGSVLESYNRWHAYADPRNERPYWNWWSHFGKGRDLN